MLNASNQLLKYSVFELTQRYNKLDPDSLNAEYLKRHILERCSDPRLLRTVCLITDPDSPLAESCHNLLGWHEEFSLSLPSLEENVEIVFSVLLNQHLVFSRH